MCLIRSQDKGSNEVLTLLFVHEKKIGLLPQKWDVSFYVTKLCMLYNCNMAEKKICLDNIKEC
jgi:hypothetical protein